MKKLLTNKKECDNILSVAKTTKNIFGTSKSLKKEIKKVLDKMKMM